MKSIALPVLVLAAPLAAQTYEDDLMEQREAYVTRMSGEMLRGAHGDIYTSMKNIVIKQKGIRHIFLVIYSEKWTMENVERLKRYYARRWQDEFGYTDIAFMNEGQKEPYAMFVVKNPR